MYVLAIDTCGPVIGVALMVGDRVLQRTARVTRGAEAHLMPWALALAAEAGVELSALDGVVAAVGPGAFTGLRVGLAAASGVALAAGCPLWPGSSLVSRGVRASDGGPVLAMLDARKSRVYAAVVEADGSVVREAGDLPPAQAVQGLADGFIATGEGALVYRELVESSGGRVCDDAADPAVDALVRLGARGLARGEGRDPADVRPVYLRAPDAKPPKDLRQRSTPTP